MPVLQDVMIVGEPSLMGGDFGEEDERLITRLENSQYDPVGHPGSGPGPGELGDPAPGYHAPAPPSWNTPTSQGPPPPSSAPPQTELDIKRSPPHS